MELRGSKWISHQAFMINTDDSLGQHECGHRSDFRFTNRRVRSPITCFFNTVTLDLTRILGITQPESLNDVV